MGKNTKIKTILLFTILLFALFLISNFVKAADATSDKALEIVYPQIPGTTTPKVVSTGLPEYVDYIFRFSVVLIGLVILGALIYNGFQYFTSFGSPEKLKTAKQGITSAFLGAIILLSAYLIFNTINPQLIILEAPPPEVTEPTVTPGIYLCNYKPDNIRGSIEKYIYGNKDEKIRAAEELKKIMQNGKNSCFRVNRSTNLDNFVFDKARHDIFVIPRIDYVFDPENPSEPRTTPVNDYGLIFHEKDNFQGEYALGALYTDDITTYPTFTAHSVIVFQKPEKEPDSSKLGVILYQCLDYNTGGFCPEGVTDQKSQSFKPEGNDYQKKVAEADLLPELRSKITTESVPGAGQGGAIYSTIGSSGVRSIKIDPLGSYFAMLFSKEHFTGFCEVISNDDPNLLDNPIGKCGQSCRMVSDNNILLKNCGPCLKSMIVIKGKVIK